MRLYTVECDGREYPAVTGRDGEMYRLDLLGIQVKDMNELIEEDLPVTFEFATRDSLPDEIKLDRLPDDASDTIRLVRIGDYDVCPCIGKHVRSTQQIGRFEMLGTNWDEHEHSFRVRFKIVQ